jgi:hypothetical protein
MLGSTLVPIKEQDEGDDQDEPKHENAEQGQHREIVHLPIPSRAAVQANVSLR